MRYGPIYAMLIVVIAGLVVAHQVVVPRPIDFSIRLESNCAEPAARIERLRLGIAPLTTPEQLFPVYEKLAEELSAALHIPVDLVARSTYTGITTLLKRGELDAAFVCSGTYCTAPDAMDVLVASAVEGKSEYRALIVVPAASTATKVEDLKGTRFLFVDHESLTGFWHTNRQLGDSAAFFSSVRFTGSHDLSLMACASELSDGAAISSTVYSLMCERIPNLANRIRIIDSSAPFPATPIVVRKSLPAARREALQAALVGLSSSPDGRKLLQGLGITGFVPAQNDAYAALAEYRP
jgi:phosphonate transport system substrate-binding protein